MTDDESQIVRGSSTGPPGLGSIPLPVFLTESEKVWSARLSEIRTLEAQRWTDHENRHREHDELMQRALTDRIEAREELDRMRWEGHMEVHRVMADQLKVTDEERKQRDATQNEWRATLNDVMNRLPSRETTDNLSKQISDIQLALAGNAGRDRAYATLMSVPGILVAVMVLVIYLTNQ